MPKGYKKTSIKDLEKKHKEVKKTIKQLEKELDKLYIEKIHLDRCIGYFNDDSEDFMKQINPPSPPPDDPSPPPPPIPPRPLRTSKIFCGTFRISALLGDTKARAVDQLSPHTSIRLRVQSKR